MALWATMHDMERSPAPRQPLAMLVRRSLVAGLLVVFALGATPLVVSARVWRGAELPARVPVRDIGTPNMNGERDGEAGVGLVPAPPRASTTTGKPGRPGDVQRQGSVVAVFEDPSDPLIVLAVENGYITVRLRCGSHCPSIHLGDYVVAEGRRRSEAVMDAVEVWVVAP